MTTAEAGPTQRKMVLIRRYERNEISLNEVTNQVDHIDNPPPGRIARGVIWLGSILLAPILSSARSKDVTD